MALRLPFALQTDSLYNSNNHEFCPFPRFLRGKKGIHIQEREEAFGGNFSLAFLCNVCVISNLVFFLFYNRYLEGLGASAAQIGLYMGALALGSVIVRPMVGAAVDRHGRKRLVFIGIILMMASTAGYFLCNRLSWLILLVRALHGVGFGCYITGIFTIVADGAPSTRRAKVIGIFGLSGMTTYAFLPAVGEFVIAHFGFRALFSAAFCSLIAGLLLSRRLKERCRETLEFPPASFISLLGQWDLLVPVGALFFYCTGVGALVSFIAVYLAPKNLSISYFFIASSAAGIMVRLRLGDLADIYGRRHVAFPAFAAGSIAIFWLSHFHYRWELLFSGFLYGTGIGLAVPAVAATVVDRVKPQDRGKGLALFTASFDLGVMAGSFAYGFLAGLIGYPHMYSFAAAIMLLAVLIGFFFRN